MKPPVWRRLIVPSTIALNELHQVIQIAMGWVTIICIALKRVIFVMARS
nr:plasmid pRiA4b ORF-3 family protein [Providencia rettgeri]